MVGIQNRYDEDFATYILCRDVTHDDGSNDGYRNEHGTVPEGIVTPKAVHRRKSSQNLDDGMPFFVEVGPQRTAIRGHIIRDPDLFGMEGIEAGGRSPGPPVGQNPSPP